MEVSSEGMSHSSKARSGEHESKGAQILLHCGGHHHSSPQATEIPSELCSFPDAITHYTRTQRNTVWT